MSVFNEIASNKMYGGWQKVVTHDSSVTHCTMTVGVYLPPQVVGSDDKVPALLWLSGLTCTEQNFVTKAAAQRMAAELGMAIIAPDTSPRGDDVADDEAYDLGQGAGFYLNATQAPWRAHFQMEDYLLKELMPAIESSFPVNGKWSISGHSMGGHGALTLHLRHPDRFCSCSAFSPIVAPSQVPWGQKAFAAYLGDDQVAWLSHDATHLVSNSQPSQQEILIDQGRADDFLAEQLKPELFAAACQTVGQPLNLRLQSDYDHSYYFIASFIDEHLVFHYEALTPEDGQV